MASPLVTLAAGVMSAGGPAAAMITTNTRVKTQLGFVGLATDVLQFSGPMVTGSWTSANARVKVNGTPTVSATATGVASNPSVPSSAPVTVSSGDPRAKGS
jgi:hypothetical protein